MAKMCLSLVFVVLVASLHMGSNPVYASSEDGAIMFDSSNLEDELEMPETCEGQSYCFEKGENYPEEKIEELLKDMHELKVDNLHQRTGVGHRYWEGGSNDESDCPSDSSESPIYYIIDQKTNKTRAVVQSPKKFQQIYSVKWCRNEGRIRGDTRHFLKRSKILSKFNIQCVSTKMDFDFFVLSDKVNPNTNKPMMERTTAKGGIPVCCRCRYNVHG